MKRNIFFSMILFFGFVSFLSASQSKPLEQYTMCRNRKIIRTIRVVKTDDGCSALYTKAGIDRKIGSGKNMRSCKQFLGNVQSNLEKAGWKCRAVAGATIEQ